MSSKILENDLSLFIKNLKLPFSPGLVMTPVNGKMISRTFSTSERLDKYWKLYFVTINTYLDPTHAVGQLFLGITIDLVIMLY